MRIGDRELHSISYDESTDRVRIIDQTRLPHQFELITLDTVADVHHAITSMQVRGAPLIGVTAAYGVYLALREDPMELDAVLNSLLASRPTAVNLAWALRRCRNALTDCPVERRAEVALALARQLEQEDAQTCASIGEHGLAVLTHLWQSRAEGQSRLNVLTHCNAGALATVDWGTALAPIYRAAALGLPIHVWVDETRPRNQGASLTCWELGQMGIPHTLIVDNAGGHLMQNGMVDLCLVGSDRTTACGDVCNKIGTYLKALAAFDNGIPFYVALPVSTIDFDIESGADIPIEERAGEEVTHVAGADELGMPKRVRLSPAGVAAANPGFDVTPARLVTGLITEHGVLPANRQALAALRLAS